jgi:hypothetical protein
MSIKSTLAMLAAVQAAGFNITKDKAIDTHDGYAWHATLSFGKKPIVTVSNGGFGGPDEFEYHLNQQEAENLLQPLNDIDAVKNEIRDGRIQFESFFLRSETATAEQKAAFEQKRAEILASPVKLTEDELGNVVDQLRDAKSLVKTFKRKCTSKILWLEKNMSNPNAYFEYKAVDTPENREKIKKGYTNGEFDCFIADLLVGL